MSIKPFLSLGEAVLWKEQNCNNCIFSYRVKPHDKWSRTLQLEKVENGDECSIKYAIDQSIRTGELDYENALKAGFNNGIQPSFCRKFMPRYDFALERKEPSFWDKVWAWMNIED